MKHKSAALGTRHYSVNLSERDILLAAATHDLRQRAGYQPPKIVGNLPGLPPVGYKFVACADVIVAAISGGEVHGCNPRVPYLLLAWHLVGSDNPYRIKQHGENIRMIPYVAMLLIRIACGATPSVDKLYRVANTASQMIRKAEALVGLGFTPAGKTAQAIIAISTATAWVAETAVAAATVTTFEEIDEVAWVASRAVAGSEGMTRRVRKWAYMDDNRAWHLACSLMLDCLDQPAKANATSS